MAKGVGGLVLAVVGLGLLWMVTAHGAAPTIRPRTVSAQEFVITFDRGAVSECTIYQEQKVREDMRETFPDGRYAPRHCWGIDDAQLSQIVDNWAWIDKTGERWLVWAEVYYWNDRTKEPTMVETNTVEVVR